MSEMNWPLSRANVKKESRKRIREMKECGVEWVEILGCNNPGEDCDPCMAAAGKRFVISMFDELPLPGCDKEHCKCVMAAAEPPTKLFYILQDGNEVGPFTIDELLGKLGRSEISRDALCASLGDSSWEPLSKIVQSGIS